MIVNQPKPIVLLDGTEGLGVGRESALGRQHRASLLVAVSNLGGATFELEGSNDGINFLPLSPLGESGSEIILEGFYTYHRLPLVIRANVSNGGAIATGAPS